MATIYIVEDDINIREIERYALKNSGYEVEEFEGSASFFKRLEKNIPSLILLDIMLPGEDGLDILTRIRADKATADVPVIMVTAKTSELDKVKGLDLGADDYIVKPFLPQELILRIYAVLRRSYKEDNPLVVLDGCTVDFDRAEVYKGNEIFFLTAKEHMLLKTLARNEGKIITVDALCEALWGDNPFGYGNSLLAHIRRIREKIEITPSKPKSLITVKGLGYKINVESRL